MTLVFDVRSSFGNAIPDSSDDARIAAIRAGDARALESLLLELVPFVRRRLHRLLGPGADLDDATQDALVELADALPRFEGRSKLTTFAHRIVVRVAYRYYGSRRTHVPLDPDAFDADARDPEVELSNREALRKLHRVLTKLPEKRRVAFVLCEIEGLDPSEAADVAETSALAMRTRLFHARSEVRRMLGVDGGSHE